MEPLEYFEEEYQKIQSLTSDINTSVLYAKDFYYLINDTYKKILDLQKDLIQKKDKETIDELIQVVQKSLSEISILVSSIHEVKKKFDQLKEY